MYFLGLTHSDYCAILQPNYCASICMPILCSWLEVQFVLLWLAHLIVNILYNDYACRRLHAIPEYISRKMQPSANILYNDYAEDLSSGYIYTTYARIHTIEMQPLCLTRIHTSVRVGKCQYLYNRLRTYLLWMTYPDTYQCQGSLLPLFI